ncbi:MAG: DUF937 domain-containing protein [Firmicutes bacterium]|nr:DUF937 domain-containing protein [Bacillota bacterium]
MDLNSIMGLLLGGSSTSGISQATGTKTSDVTSILANALPSLLAGANKQASQSSTADSFAQALAAHAADDTTNISSFYRNVDLEDGSKIIQHLFGGQTNSTIKAVANQAGVTQKQASSVLSAAAPLLMSLIGQQTTVETKTATTQAAKTAQTTNLMSSLLSNVDVGSLIGGLLGSGSTSTKKTTKKKSGVDLSDGLDAGDVIGLLGNLLK